LIASLLVPVKARTDQLNCLARLTASTATASCTRTPVAIVSHERRSFFHGSAAPISELAARLQLSPTKEVF